MNMDIDQKIKYIDPKELKRHPKNPNLHPDDQIEKLAQIIESQGFRVPIITSRASGFIVSGNGRHEAAMLLEMPTVPVIEQDFKNEKQEIEFMIQDNAISEWSKLDVEAVKLEIENLDIEVSDLGIKEDTMLYHFQDEPPEEREGEDDIPDKENVESVVKPGDIWILGNHRIMCADSTKAENIQKLMNGNKADISFTSPPYNAGLEIKSKVKSKIKKDRNSKYKNSEDSDTQNNFKVFLNDSIKNMVEFSEYAFVNIQMLKGNKISLIEHLFDCRDFLCDVMVWDKLSSQPDKNKNVLNSRFEFINVFSKKANRAIGTKNFRNIDNVLQLSSKKGKDYAKVHKATFPVEFADFFVMNFCENSVLDPFSGTGTTLISCEKNDRTFYGMELDPEYCDIIIKRWENFTGEKAVKEVL